MRFDALLAVCACVATWGCVASSSVHPILTDDDLTHDVDLSGRWRHVDPQGKEDKASDIKVEEWDNHARYDVTLERPAPAAPREGQKVIPTEYEMAVGRIGKHRYLQIRRSESITGGPSFFEGVVTYAFARFELKGGVLFVYPIDDAALEALLPKTNMAHLMHDPGEWARNIVLTESTPRMQEFIEKHQATIFAAQPVKYRRLGTGVMAQSPAPAPHVASR